MLHKATLIIWQNRIGSLFRHDDVMLPRYNGDPTTDEDVQVVICREVLNYLKTDMFTSLLPVKPHNYVLCFGCDMIEWLDETIGYVSVQIIWG